MTTSLSIIVPTEPTYEQEEVLSPSSRPEAYRLLYEDDVHRFDFNEETNFTRVSLQPRIMTHRRSPWIHDHPFHEVTKGSGVFMPAFAKISFLIFRPDFHLLTVQEQIPRERWRYVLSSAVRDTENCALIPSEKRLYFRWLLQGAHCDECYTRMLFYMKSADQQQRSLMTLPDFRARASMIALLTPGAHRSLPSEIVRLVFAKLHSIPCAEKKNGRFQDLGWLRG